MTDTDLRRQNRIRIQQLSGKVLDACDRVLDAINVPPDNKPSLTIARRQTANLLGLAKLCANSTCRRAHCCRGEPLDCLRTVVFLLPPQQIERLLLQPQGRHRRKRGRNTPPRRALHP